MNTDPELVKYFFDIYSDVFKQYLSEKACHMAFRSQIIIAKDPNLKLGFEGQVSCKQALNYTIEYENEGEGTAFGVYVIDMLDNNLNASTLIIGQNGIYNPSTRTITWLIGEVGPNENGSVTFTVNVNDNISTGVEILNFAIVCFPSVPETTRTNGVLNIVAYPHDIALLNVTPSKAMVGVLEWQKRFVEWLMSHGATWKSVRHFVTEVGEPAFETWLEYSNYSAIDEDEERSKKFAQDPEFLELISPMGRWFQRINSRIVKEIVP